jgi:hypothetical protein
MGLGSFIWYGGGVAVAAILYRSEYEDRSEFWVVSNGYDKLVYTLPARYFDPAPPDQIPPGFKLIIWAADINYTFKTPGEEGYFDTTLINPFDDIYPTLSDNQSFTWGIRRFPTPATPLVSEFTGEFFTEGQVASGRTVHLVFAPLQGETIGNNTPIPSSGTSRRTVVSIDEVYEYTGYIISLFEWNQGNIPPEVAAKGYTKSQLYRAQFDGTGRIFVLRSSARIHLMYAVVPYTDPVPAAIPSGQMYYVTGGGFMNRAPAKQISPPQSRSWALAHDGSANIPNPETEPGMYRPEFANAYISGHERNVFFFIKHAYNAETQIFTDYEYIQLNAGGNISSVPVSPLSGSNSIGNNIEIPLSSGLNSSPFFKVHQNDAYPDWRYPLTHLLRTFTQVSAETNVTGTLNACVGGSLLVDRILIGNGFKAVISFSGSLLGSEPVTGTVTVTTANSEFNEINSVYVYTAFTCVIGSAIDGFSVEVALPAAGVASAPATTEILMSIPLILPPSFG